MSWFSRFKVKTLDKTVNSTLWDSIEDRLIGNNDIKYVIDNDDDTVKNAASITNESELVELFNAGTVVEAVDGSQYTKNAKGAWDKTSTMDLTDYAAKSYVDSAVAGYATQEYVNVQLSDLVAAAPDALNTLNELAAALGDDANFASTVNESIAAKLPKSGGTMTGYITLHAAPESDLHPATKAYVDSAVSSSTVSNADVWNAFTFSDGLSFSEGTLTATGSGGISNVVEDTTPQLGGALDAQGNYINNVLTLSGTSNLNMYVEPGFNRFLYLGNWESTSQVHISASHDVTIGGFGTDVNIHSITYPSSDGTAGQVLTTNGSGALSFTTVSSGIALDNLSAATATPEGTGSLAYNNSTGVFTMYPPDLSSYHNSNVDVWNAFTYGTGIDNIEGTLSVALSAGQNVSVDGNIISVPTANIWNAFNYGDGIDMIEGTLTATGGGGGIALDNLSAATATPEGTGSLAYNNSTGQFTMYPPDLSSYHNSNADVWNAFNYGDGIDMIEGTLTATGGGGGLPDGVIAGVIGDSSVTPTIYNGYRKLLTITRTGTDSASEFYVDWNKSLKYNSTYDYANRGFIKGRVEPNGTSDIGWLAVSFNESYRRNGSAPQFHWTYVDGNTAEIWVNFASSYSSWSPKHEAVWGLSGTYETGNGVTIEIAPRDTPITAYSGISRDNTNLYTNWYSASYGRTYAYYANTLTTSYVSQIVAGSGVSVSPSYNGGAITYTISATGGGGLQVLFFDANNTYESWQTINFTFGSEADAVTFLNSVSEGSNLTITDTQNMVGNMYWSLTVFAGSTPSFYGYNGAGYAVGLYGLTGSWTMSEGASGPGTIAVQ